MCFCESAANFSFSSSNILTNSSICSCFSFGTDSTIFFFSSFESEIEPASSRMNLASSNFKLCGGTFTFRTAGNFAPSLKLAGVVSSGPPAGGYPPPCA